MADPDPPEAHPAPDSGAGHKLDGLDLARTIARSYQNTDALGRPRARRSKGSNPGGGQAGGGQRRSTGPQVTGAYPDERDPQLLEAAMARMVAEQGWKTDLAVHAVFGRWSSIVGAEVAQHCRPQRLVDAELFVSADSTAWATQLRLLSPTVVAKMNQQLGDGTVARVFVVGPQAPSWKRGRRAVRGRGPRDTYG